MLLDFFLFDFFFVLTARKVGLSLSCPCSGENKGSDSCQHCLQLLELSPSQFLQSPDSNISLPYIIYAYTHI